MGSKRRESICVNCKVEVGEGTNEVPFVVNGADDNSRECWCARCFCYIRSPLEPNRFNVGSYFPVACASCQKNSVAIGKKKCMQCGSYSIYLMFPR